MRTCPRSCFHRPSPRGTSAMSSECENHLVCFLMNSCSLLDLRQRHVGPTKLCTYFRVAGEELNLEHSPARGIIGMFMNKMLLHLHLQLVSLHTRSDLWLNPLCSHRADFFRFLKRAQQGREIVSWQASARRSDRSRFCNRRSSVLSS